MFKIGLRLFKGLILFILCLQLATGGGLASDVSKTYQPAKETKAGEHSYNLSKVRFGASASTEDRGIFYIDYLLPLFYSEDQNTLLFLNPKQTYFTPFSDEINLGTGIRHIFDDKYILGLHFFYDKKYSQKKKWHNQRGYGFEFLSEPFDFRFNYYDPTGKAKVVNDGYEFGQMNLVYYQGLEEPLEGFDFEFGFPITPKKIKTRLYFGGFSYDSNLAKDREGYRVRTETNLTNWFSLDITFNNYNAGETEFIGGLRVTIPLELGRILSRKNPLKTTPQQSYIKDRLFERVVRDIDVQSQSSTKKEVQTDKEIIYVDNANDTGTEDGTLSRPYLTIANALADSRYVGLGGNAKYIYVFRGDGTSTGYDEAPYTLSDDVILWGSGYNGGFKGIPTYGYPVLDGVGNDVIQLANNNTVMGLEITGGSNGISANGVSGGNINHNRIQSNNQGINIQGNASDFTISGNTISGNTGSYPYYTGHGIYINNNYNTMSNFTISGNTITSNSGNGVYFYNYGGNMSDFTFSGNTIQNNGGSGVYIYNSYFWGTVSDFSFSGNTITGNSGDGVHFYDWWGNYIYNMDLGGGALSSPGNNSIYNNVGFDINTNTSGTVSAKSNWWGDADPSDQVSGNVDYSNPLPSDPNQ